MNPAIDKLIGVVDVVVEVIGQTAIGVKIVGIEHRPRFDVLADFRMELGPSVILNYHCPYSSAALKDAHNRRFVVNAAALDGFLPFLFVHVLRFPADIRFVAFDFAIEHFARRIVLCGLA